ncbi:TetR/AcrR family transcriptional regulator [Pseudooceanicola algae]|uniref:HTH-type transcriptional regulator BetI n=1 Tax=Pseudooceanicola algae TaxID=1537215 RepID=A0A418SK49_9RHOB|nr:TetR/AcrR family transcriptional regulator [Pseudooceanicola algae]QPM92177.1 HTH-type transcriptional regulator BetI [Pseudooceanicola algae]
MDQNFNSVKIKRDYHHGDLKQALIDSALAVLADKGVEAFSLRETARRAGVSPAAPKHHFTDTKGLLTTLAAIAFARLADELESADQAAGQGRRDRLMAQAAAYIDFATAQRALFDLMWRAPLLDLDDEGLLKEKARAFDCPDRLIRGADAPRIPHDDPAMAPTIASWSLVHGYVRLSLDGGLGHHLNTPATLSETLLPSMLDMLGTAN